ncbi:MAG: hypothetical protein J3R72DRAFT_185230 [Linnemannia gamsii]|nr:MAG: hypothetical protein J3R72DRAFT_185230 [Linnemannia gamsii]
MCVCLSVSLFLFLFLFALCFLSVRYYYSRHSLSNPSIPFQPSTLSSCRASELIILRVCERERERGRVSACECGSVFLYLLLDSCYPVPLHSAWSICLLVEVTLRPFCHCSVGWFVGTRPLSLSRLGYDIYQSE